MTPEEFREMRADSRENWTENRALRFRFPPVNAPKTHRKYCPCKSCLEKSEVTE